MFNEEANIKYLKLAKKGDKNARDLLVLNNKGLIYAMCNNPKYKYLDRKEDLESIGIIALLEAIDSYRFDKNTKFSTYATRNIEFAYKSLIKKYFKSAKDVSLNAFVCDGVEQINQIQDKQSLESFEEVENVCDANMIIKVAKKVCTQKELEIFKYRFLADKKESSLQDIAENVNMSKEGIRLNEQRIIKKIKKYIEHNKVEL